MDMSEVTFKEHGGLNFGQRITVPCILALNLSSTARLYVAFHQAQ